MAESLSEKLGLEPTTEVADMLEGCVSVPTIALHVEADRRATVDRVVWFLAHHQDAQGVDTWPARRALRELLGEEGGGNG